MKRFLREYAVPAAQLLIKLLTAVRTGVDTFVISVEVVMWLRVLNVILLDGVFMTFWLIAAYAGTNEWARRVRPFAVLGAAVMYVFMFAIGFEAHHDLLAFAVRLAGGIALAMDVWDYVSELVRSWVQAWKNRPMPSTGDYAQRLVHRGLRTSYNRAAREIQRELDQMALTGMRQELPALVAGVSRSVAVDQSSSANDYDPTANARWQSVKDRIPSGEFSRTTVEELADCGKTLAVRIINAAERAGDVRRTRHGFYTRVQEAQIVEVGE